MTPSHYFVPDPAVPSAPRRVRLTLPDLDLDLRTDRGVFSPDRVDPGTRYLLATAPLPPAGARHLLDLGCGYGPVALTLARRSPEATVWAVDTNPRALALCADNAVAAQCPGVRTLLATPERPAGDLPADVRFDGIWSNPPIRIGKAALHDLLSHWLDLLSPRGRAWLVVNRHLGADSLQRWLAARGWPTKRLGSRAGYRVLEVRCAAP
ncbi:MAG: class I SAM-dependent methyltransferase [Acidimicrobiales bacterium]|nr:class I SAM-dependent methyltransferase [Acidimicrobiales bacterium]